MTADSEVWIACNISRKTKKLSIRRAFSEKVVCSSSRLFANATKFVVELLNTTSAVNEALFTGVGWVRIGRNVLNNDLILYTVDRFRFLGSDSGLGQKFLTGGYVYKTDGMGLRMDIGFHGSK